MDDRLTNVSQTAAEARKWEKRGRARWMLLIPIVTAAMGGILGGTAQYDKTYLKALQEASQAMQVLREKSPQQFLKEVTDEARNDQELQQLPLDQLLSTIQEKKARNAATGSFWGGAGKGAAAGGGVPLALALVARNIQTRMADKTRKQFYAASAATRGRR